MNRLFSPFAIASLELANRIIIAPMCQYSAVEGCATDWHLIHLGSLSHSGAALLIVEATSVSAAARITSCDLGLYNDDNEAALARVLHGIRSYSQMPLAIQLAHAGRKASSRLPWEGGKQIPSTDPGGWRALAPSATPYAAREQSPIALDHAGLDEVREQFAASARRAVRLGFRGIELHSAHGYLLHEFLSPISNQRDDAYGGSLQNRMRFPLQVFDAVRDAVPGGYPLWVRLSATDYVAGGWDIEDSIAYSRALRERGCPVIHVSSGGLSPHQSIKPVPGYQVDFATRIKQEAGIPTIAVGLITEPAQAQAIIEQGRADAVSLARAMLYDPRWPWHAAAALGAEVIAPPQYWRSQPSAFKNLFIDAKVGTR